MKVQRYEMLFFFAEMFFLYIFATSSEGKDAREDVNARTVKGLNIRFKPGKAIKDAIKNPSFVFAEDLVSK